MAKEKFNWKGLFINDEGADNDQPVEKSAPKSETSTTSFPQTNPTETKFPQSTVKASDIANSTLATVVEMYESGFESLNQPGYDFYEFFKAIKAVGSNDASVYKMALTMAQSVDSGVSKAKLLTQGEFYVNEIDKVHKQYQKQGNSKKDQISAAKKAEKSNLSAEILALEKQLIEIQNQISVKKDQLASLDSSLLNDVSEIDQKIAANDMARAKILETIMTVVNGIKNNL